MPLEEVTRLPHEEVTLLYLPRRTSARSTSPPPPPPQPEREPEPQHPQHPQRPQRPPINVTPEIPSEMLRNERHRPTIPAYPNPNQSKMERECCRIMEEIYRAPFVTVRPDFLSNPETGRNLEIDCYNHDLRIGLEYNGPTHYMWPNHTSQTYDQFIAQIRRDQYKLDACDAAGIYLITVPHNVPQHLLRDYITYYLPENVSSRMRARQPPVQIEQQVL